MQVGLADALSMQHVIALFARKAVVRIQKAGFAETVRVAGLTFSERFAVKVSHVGTGVTL